MLQDNTLYVFPLSKPYPGFVVGAVVRVQGFIVLEDVISNPLYASYASDPQLKNASSWVVFTPYNDKIPAGVYIAPAKLFELMTLKYQP